jgi:DNA repair exonuclease SbcCD ATPase subunit
MKTTRLKLVNFGSHSDTEVIFGDDDLIGIIGEHDGDDEKSNGAGKSTLVEAMLYADYGKCRTLDISAMVKHGADRMSVEHDFITSNGVKICIIRGYRITSSGKGKGTLSVQKGDDEPVTGGNAGGELLDRILNVDYNTFIATSFFMQEKSDAFTSATSAERKDYLRKVDDLSIFERARKKASDEEIRVNNEISSKQGLIVDLQNDIDVFDIKQMKANIKKNELDIENRRKEVSELEVKQKKYDAMKENRKKKKSLKDEMDDQQAKNNEYADKIEEIQDDINTKTLVLTAKQKESKKEPEYEELKEMPPLPDNNEYKRIAKIRDDMSEKWSTAKAKEEVFNNNIKSLLVKAEEDMIGLEDGSICGACKQSLPANMVEEQKLQLKEKIDEYNKLKDEFANVAKLEADYLKSDIDVKNFDKVLKEYMDIHNENVDIEARNNEKRTAYESLTGEIKSLKEHIVNQEKTQLEWSDLNDKAIQRYDEIKKIHDEIEIDDTFVDNTITINTFKLEIDTMVKSVGSMTQQLVDYEEDKKKLAGLKMEISDKAQEVKVYIELKNAFGKDGIPNLIIENTLIEIENITNGILNEVMPDMRVYFETQKENKKKKDGETTIQEVLDILVELNGEIRPYETYSGGERTLINFAIRFAISRYLAQKGGKRIEMVVMDEVFGALDDDNRNKVISALQSLRRQFKQIVCISHTNLKGIFPSYITVTRDRHGSHIK